jgi:ankyrin repeat protein
MLRPIDKISKQQPFQIEEIAIQPERNEDEIAEHFSETTKALPTLFSLAAKELKSDFYDIIELCRKCPDGYPPVAYAVKLQRYDVVKFLLNHGEAVDARLPHKEHWLDVGDWHPDVRHFGNSDGLTALELAIDQQDLEMVNILTKYNPSNCANPLLVRTELIVVPINFSARVTEILHTPLSKALTTGNKALVEAIIEACTAPELLFEAYEQIGATQETEIMRLWAERYTFLIQGKPLSEKTIQTIFSTSLDECIKNNDLPKIKQFLDFGWFLSTNDVKHFFDSNDPSCIELLVNHSLFKSGISPVTMAVDTGRVDILKAYIEKGFPSDGLLVQATKQQQKAIVEYLLELPISQSELEEARTIAYKAHSYDVMELIEAKILEK